MPREAPSIVKLAERMLLELERVVRHFPRYHKYAIGAELRTEAREVARSAHRAWRDVGAREQRIAELSDRIDNLKLSIMITQRLEAFRSFGQFEALWRLISDLGQQCGGWQKHEHSKGQNRRTSPSAGRAQILSAPGASQEANL